MPGLKYNQDSVLKRRVLIGNFKERDTFWPFLLANVLQALYGGADLFVVGQYDDAASVAAVAIGSQVMQTVTGVILGLTTGTTVLIANDCYRHGSERLPEDGVHYRNLHRAVCRSRCGTDLSDGGFS